MNGFGAILLQILSVFLKVLPFLLVIFILVGIKILSDYRHYGNKIFNFVKKRENTDDLKNRLIVELKNLDSNTKFLYNENYNCDLVVVNNRGIYLVSYLTYKGIISGTNYDKYLYAGKMQIDNPFYYEEELKKRILSKIETSVHKIVLLDYETLIKVLDDTTRVNYVNTIANSINNDKILYNTEEVDILAKNI